MGIKAQESDIKTADPRGRDPLAEGEYAFATAQGSIKCHARQDNKIIVGRWFEGFWGNPWNPRIIDELAAPDMLLQYSLHAPRRGRGDVRNFMERFRTAFPDLNFWGAADLIIYRPDGKLAAMMIQTQMVLPREPGGDSSGEHSGGLASHRYSPQLVLTKPLPRFWPVKKHFRAACDLVETGRRGAMRETGNDNSLLEIARIFHPRILAERDHIEESRRLPEDLTRELAQAGFFRIFLPKAYGGLDLTPMEGMEVFEQLARADASVAWCVWNGNTHWTAAQLPPETARTIYANPDVITANSTRASGQAQIVAGGYRVNGRWPLVSGCELGTWMVLLSVIHEDGKPRLTGAGAPETRFMLLPSQACEIIDTWTVGGLRGTGSHDVAVKDIFVPSSYGSGFTDPHVLPEPRYRIPPFSRVIPGLGAMAVGIAQTAIETFIEVAGGKTPERTTQMLRDNHGAQVRVSQAVSLVRSARLFLFDSLDRLWRRLVTNGGATMEARADVRLAASHAVNCAVQAIDLLYLGAGASALYASCPLERAFRDVHAITQHIGVHPRVMETTGRILFGLEPDTPLL